MTSAVFEDKTVSARTRRFVAFYSIVLLALVNLAATGLIGPQVLIIFKYQLHLGAEAKAIFGFCTDTPYFVGFAFGFLRDRWRPCGQGDRGYFAVVPILLAVTYGSALFVSHSYFGLMAVLILNAALCALLGAASQGLLAALSKEYGITGLLGTATLVAVRLSASYGNAVGGWLGDRSVSAPFYASAGVSLLVTVMALWRPRSIFRSGQEVFVTVTPEGAMDAIRRLLRHKAVYLPAITLFCWEFAPGWGTPLDYFLTDTLHGNEAAFGAARGMQYIGNVVAALLYLWLYRRWGLRTLLYLGTVLGVLGGPAFLLIHSPAQANIVCFIAGASCGMALAAYYSLLIRCCPKELEGVAYMLSFATFTLAADTSDIFGSWLFERGGFGLALGISTAVTALIFVPISLVPRSISDPVEGEPIVDADPPREAALAS